MVSGMRVNRSILTTNGLVVILAILSISFSVINCEEPKKPKEEEYDYKPPGYPGSGTNQGKFIICTMLVLVYLINI